MRTMGKRKPESSLGVCSEVKVASFGVNPSELPARLQPRCTTVGPIGGGSPEKVPTNQTVPIASHVADEEDMWVNTFWSLLEQAGYTVW